MNNQLRNIYLIGMTGVGKSTVGKILANRLRWAFVDINETMEAIYGRSLREIIESFGEESLRNMESTTLQELSQGEHQVFACNSDSVLDESKMGTMQTTGITIWLDAPANELVQRIERMEDPIVPEEGEPSKVIETMLKEREAFYQQADARIATDEFTPESAAEQILQLLRKL
ncbi:MAG: shikimate kinase [Candidatus Marinimicrobia bacterium]|jgi:shikimate kinase|nr:hypothetical protein [Candidatus Neomarinimicrobiota bacterium]MDP6456886.1 shikimate kinase [Candidatus Neomarinimicrobiota bacterium]MDP6592763.1 shikimate kinase [Candidatus Neomarinimicrobiota bacterium]MDP6836284.1 shikimate kinase [Candidatus Neomarinimicrobiota bacterium]|tara:strand:+ start:5903 stop:6421 length:519 start_codon:yes stop_codon:yes gene_type:complete